MSHEHAPHSSQEKLASPEYELDAEAQAYLAEKAGTSLQVVLDGGTPRRRMDDGWMIDTDNPVDHIDEEGKAWIRLAKPVEEGSLVMVARIDGIAHFNPVEAPENSAETHRAAVEQLGEEAVSDVVEVPAEQEDAEAIDTPESEAQIQELKQKLADIIRLRDAEGERVGIILTRVDSLRDEAERLQAVLHRTDERMPLQANPSVRDQLEVFVTETRKLYDQLQQTESDPAVYSTIADTTDLIQRARSAASPEAKQTYTAIIEMLESVSHEQVVLGRRLDINGASHNLIATSAQFLGSVNNLDKALYDHRATVVEAGGALQYTIRDLRAFIDGLQRQHQRMRTSSEQLHSYSQLL